MFENLPGSLPALSTEDEKNFQLWILPNRIQLFSRAVYVGSIITLLFAIPDYMHIGNVKEYYYSLVGRISIPLAAFILLRVVRKKNNPAVLNFVLFVISSIITAGSSVIIINMQNQPAIAGLSEMLVVVIFYIFLPQGIITSIFTGLLASITFLLIRLFIVETSTDDMLALGLTYMMANIFGIIYIRNYYYSRKLEYAFLQEEKNSRILLENEIIERKKLEKALRELSTVDELTQLYNRRFIMDIIRHKIHQFERYRETFSLLLIDVDFFKQVNDNFGHQEGDMVLQSLSKIFIEQTRKSDIVSRFGGEEFIVLCPHHSLISAEMVAEKIRMTVEKTPIRPGVKVTVSIGVCEFRANETPEGLLHRCDIALYKAKNGGRNQVISSIE